MSYARTGSWIRVARQRACAGRGDVRLHPRPGQEGCARRSRRSTAAGRPSAAPALAGGELARAGGGPALPGSASTTAPAAVASRSGRAGPRRGPRADPSTRSARARVLQQEPAGRPPAGLRTPCASSSNVVRMSARRSAPGADRRGSPRPRRAGHAHVHSTTSGRSGALPRPLPRPSLASPTTSSRPSSAMIMRRPERSRAWCQRARAGREPAGTYARLDVRMPGLDGIAATRELSRGRPATRR